MADPRLFRLRVVYRKSGRLAYLSHLEVTRALERAVRRSGLAFAITNGFSPHMRIAFGAALPVGVGGEAEIFDVFLTGYIAPAKALAALQEASMPDLSPVSCAYVESNAPAASVALPLSTYVAVFDAALRDLVVPDVVTVRRKNKEKQLVVADFLEGVPAVSGNEVRFSLRAKDEGSLRADAFLQSVLESTCGANDGGEGPGQDSARVPALVSLTRIEQGL